MKYAKTLISKVKEVFREAKEEVAKDQIIREMERKGASAPLVGTMRILTYHQVLREYYHFIASERDFTC